MNCHAEDIVTAYQNLIAARRRLFDAMELESNAIEKFEQAKRKALLEQLENDASPGDVKKAKLLEIIGNEYTAMREAEKNKREAVFDHDIAKIRTQMFRDLIEWQKMVPESKPVNASGRNRPRKKKTKPREKLMLLP